MLSGTLWKILVRDSSEGPSKNNILHKGEETGSVLQHCKETFWQNDQNYESEKQRHCSPNDCSLWVGSLPWSEKSSSQ